MLLYHGSNIEFEELDMRFSKEYRDFGRGIYFAESYWDALGSAIKRSGNGFLYTFEIPDEVFEAYSVLQFCGVTEEWARFVFLNRTQKVNNDYDIVIGPMAGNAINVLAKQFRKDKTAYEEVAKTFRKQITTSKFGIQYLISNQKILNQMVLVDKEYYSDSDY